VFEPDDCPYLPDLWAAGEDALDAERAALQAHLAGCPICRSAQAEAGEVSRLLRAGDPASALSEPAAAGLRSSLLEACAADLQAETAAAAHARAGAGRGWTATRQCHAPGEPGRRAASGLLRRAARLALASLATALALLSLTWLLPGITGRHLASMPSEREVVRRPSPPLRAIPVPNRPATAPHSPAPRRPARLPAPAPAAPVVHGARLARATGPRSGGPERPGASARRSRAPAPCTRPAQVLPRPRALPERLVIDAEGPPAGHRRVTISTTIVASGDPASGRPSFSMVRSDREESGR
jgi:hypothetical protein